ncbi:hypothetical protein [Tropicibacter naphthalenivorans]|uniref:Sulfotransferase domain protein n=1 Tax=Tropicibacter naphthalenivorans TaxID=441103 RepID=A0A0N7M197_9RHOB|nr:hypothetical protein [Tropicibacter naphthalenivorans]CUH82657.1 hypothetical protein TRN7648_04199 [Tropicibacter naphthalenivorans]SMD10193.1 hypothetical protein SAMN04488093_12121 [Tropicibacter naphthalenivorans]
MQVILHTGVHCTDDDRILKCLLRNAETWRHEGVAIPGPSNYRQLLSDAVNRIGTKRPNDDVRDILLDAIVNEDPAQVDRLILSNQNFFSVPKLMFGGQRIYYKAEARLRTLSEIFKGDDLELFMGLRDPATFLPAAFAATPHTNFDAFLDGVDPMQFRWSDLIRRLRADVPEVPITIWCNEDTPLIWGQLIRDMAGIEITRKITGAFDLFSSIISREGMKRFRAFLKENPTINEMQKRRVMSAFLDKYALDEEIEEEVDLPWDEAYIDMLTELYEDDIYTISRIPGVTVIAP